MLMVIDMSGDDITGATGDSGLGSSHLLATGQALIFVLPYKIQRQRLEDMKNSMLKKNIAFSNKLEQKVTHVVTEFESLEQVERQVLKDGLKLPEGALVVSTKWLVECLKASRVKAVSNSDLLTKEQTVPCDSDSSKLCPGMPERSQVGSLQPETCALEILQLHAELRDASQDYSRALAFRRASCVLKSLPFVVKSPSQLAGVKDIGGHVLRVVADILDGRASSEVEDILSSQWFHQMKTFTQIFGVGPSTAKNWIARGWRTVEDVRKAGCPSNDWRMIWGLAFYEDLTSPVSKAEAHSFTAIVQNEAEKILPGTLVTLAGGFRRGKQSGHDVDLLITHPKEGQEVGILQRLLSALASRGLVLVGHREKDSFRPDIYQDQGSSMKGQLDHFEKWLGICKFPKSFQRLRASESGTDTSVCGESRVCTVPGTDTSVCGESRVCTVPGTDTSVCGESRVCTVPGTDTSVCGESRVCTVPGTDTSVCGESHVCTVPGTDTSVCGESRVCTVPGTDTSVCGESRVCIVPGTDISVCGESRGCTVPGTDTSVCGESRVCTVHGTDTSVCGESRVCIVPGTDTSVCGESRVCTVPGTDTSVCGESRVCTVPGTDTSVCGESRVCTVPGTDTSVCGESRVCTVPGTDTSVCGESRVCTVPGTVEPQSEAASCSKEDDTEGFVSFDDLLDEMFEPRFKKPKLAEGVQRQPDILAQTQRHWLARRVDLIVSPYSQFYFALFGWTGSKHFNRDARLFAQRILGLKLTSHGLFDTKQQKHLTAASEEDVFSHLQLPYREPTDRNC